MEIHTLLLTFSATHKYGFIKLRGFSLLKLLGASGYLYTPDTKVMSS